MKILMLKGSPHPQGTTALLAESFTRGATAAGHTVEAYDVAKMNVRPCLGCDYCRKHETRCIQQDDMEALRKPLLEADVVAFVTPTYYFGVCAQLKSVIDRFYALNSELQQAQKKACLLAACGDNEAWSIAPVQANYEAICRYLGWENSGEVTAIGAYVREDAVQSDYPAQAERLGRSL